MTAELPSLNALRAFVAAARWQSISRAADTLHVTHGAVSRQVRQLETELGQPLFQRVGRGLLLTPAGEQLYHRAASAFEELREAWQALARSPSSSALVLGCPASVLARWMIPRMERLSRDLPGLTLHLAAQEAPLESHLAGLDAALLLAEPPWPSDWQVRPLAAERIGPVLSPRHVHYHRLRQAPPRALLAESLLHTTSRPQAWGQWATACGLPVDEIRHGQGFAHLYYLLEAAVAGLGVAIAPEQLVSDDLAAGRLEAPWGFQSTPAQWLLATPRHLRDDRIEALEPWLKKQLAPTAEDASQPRHD
ncbi:LysR family transcriptional regulator [Frateuria aurantia]